MSETLFKQVNYTVGSLIKFIELGILSLPQIPGRTQLAGCSRQRRSDA